MRRNPIVAAACLSILFSVDALAQSPPGIEAARPNILLLLIDDMGYADLGANHDQASLTPNLDTFANQGARFTRHYADSTCSPARAALMTGRNPARLGYQMESRGISPEVDTLPRSLRDRGYLTFHVGKWHLGHTTADARPEGIGFDQSFGFMNQWLMQVPFQDPPTADSYGVPGYFDPWLSSTGGGSEQYKGHLSDILTAHTSQLISNLATQERPWFINHWLYLPHTPHQPAERYRAGYGDTPKELYRALINQLDDSIGQILDTLAETGQDRNTIVVIASDNGSIDPDSNAPFYGDKLQYYEGGLRTPLLIRWPGAIPAQLVVSDTVSIMDIYPTLMRLIGEEAPEGLDGRDFSSVFTGGMLDPTRDLFWEYHLGNRYEASMLSADGRWRFYSRLVPNGTSELILNDLVADPTGRLNVIDDYPDIASRMQQQYLDWHARIHRLDLDYESLNANGRGILTGDEMQRTPGYGSITFAVAFRRDEVDAVDGAIDELEIIPQEASFWERLRNWDFSSETEVPAIRGAEVVVEQPGRWRILLDPATDTAIVDLGVHRLTGEVPRSDDCQSLIYTGNFRPKHRNWNNIRDMISGRLFVNGIETDGMHVEDVLGDEDNLDTPTVVGATMLQTHSFSGRLGEPIVLNAMVSDNSPITPIKLHDQLCTAFDTG